MLRTCVHSLLFAALCGSQCISQPAVSSTCEAHLLIPWSADTHHVVVNRAAEGDDPYTWDFERLESWRSPGSSLRRSRPNVTLPPKEALSHNDMSVSLLTGSAALPVAASCRQHSMLGGCGTSEVEAQPANPEMRRS